MYFRCRVSLLRTCFIYDTSQIVWYKRTIHFIWSSYNYHNMDIFCFWI